MLQFLTAYHTYRRIFLILWASFAFLILSRNNANRFPYSIKDFKKSHQSYLNQIVSRGIVTHDTAARFIENNLTDEELRKLSKSEHPVLRAVAYRAMMDRSTIDHFKLIMNNLDDTAIVATDAGEWGIEYKAVSDDILHNGKWKDTTARNLTIEKVLLNHNYLSSIYYKLQNVEPKEIYYSSIRQMTSPGYDPENLVGNIPFKKVQYALYALAKYKKVEDIKFIKETLMQNVPWFTDVSFNLMKNYPNEAYLEIYQQYHKRTFYYEICRERRVDNAVAFVQSLATYKNDQSATILNQILNRKPFTPCPADTNYLRQDLLYAIWNNKCPAYLPMINQIKSDIEKLEAENLKFSNLSPIEIDQIPPDTSFEPIRWWR